MFWSGSVVIFTVGVLCAVLYSHIRVSLRRLFSPGEGKGREKMMTCGTGAVCPSGVINPISNFHHTYHGDPKKPSTRPHR